MLGGFERVAWWRTGLTALAIGRVIPGLNHGLAVIGYGSLRRGAMEARWPMGVSPIRLATPTRRWR